MKLVKDDETAVEIPSVLILKLFWNDYLVKLVLYTIKAHPKCSHDSLCLDT